MEETERLPSWIPDPDDSKKINLESGTTPSLVGNNDDEAQMDPLGFAKQKVRSNSEIQRTRTSLIFVLFEYCLAEGLLKLQFSDQLSTIWRLDKFSNASFHSSFQKSVLQWRKKITENERLRKGLIKTNWKELESLSYPMPKRSGKRPIRKRGYRDKGSTRPLHQRFRTDRDTAVSVYLADLVVVEKIRVYGRRPTVTYRRLPFSREIGRLLELGLLRKEGDFMIPVQPQED
jgi:hypothetical protein